MQLNGHAIPSHLQTFILKGNKDVVSVENTHNLRPAVSFRLQHRREDGPRRGMKSTQHEIACGVTCKNIMTWHFENISFSKVLELAVNGDLVLDKQLSVLEWLA